MTPAKHHFLVVDDQPITRLIIITMLNGLGYPKASEAENGQQALDLLQSGNVTDIPVTCVITDWNMPVMDGLTLLRTIRATDTLQHLPVLMVTADTRTNTIDAALQAGADGYMDKGLLSAGTLNEMLDRILK